jgi:AAA15 family ATPase/GTPase
LIGLFVWFLIDFSSIKRYYSRKTYFYYGGEMLKTFKVNNFKNFKKEIILDLTSSNYEFNSDAIHNKVIKNSIIYGYNASGKSNIVNAIMDITVHLTDYNVNKDAYELYLSLDSKIDHASFYYEFSFGKDILIYTYKKKNLNEIFDEKIVINNNLIIDGENKRIDLSGTENLNLNYDSQISFVKYILRNTVLSEEDLNVKILKKFEKFINGMLSFNNLHSPTYQGLVSGSERLQDIILREGSLCDFESFLREAGLPYTLKVRKINDNDTIVVVFETGKEVEFFNVASKGTSALTLFYTWLLRFDKVSLVLMDEFDSYYHNDLSKFVLKKVKKMKVQSIFSSHNTSAMSNDILRPDCYFLLEDNVISSLGDRSSKELRQAHNLEKMYRAGAFANNE